MKNSEIVELNENNCKEYTAEEAEAKMLALMVASDKPKSVAYFYNAHYGSYFGVTQYSLNADGSYESGIPSGEYDAKALDAAGVPYKGVKEENTNINYI